MTGSHQHLDGLFEPVSASVQPAKIARELARAVRDAGVHVYEHSQVRAIEYGPPTSVVLERGSITPIRWCSPSTPGRRRSRRSAPAWSWSPAMCIATAAAPGTAGRGRDQDGLCISDGRRLVNYYHATPDGRIVFGKGGGTLAYNNRITASL